MKVSDKSVRVINVVLIFCILFITAGRILEAKDISLLLYQVFHEMLYIPIVFILPFFCLLLFIALLFKRPKSRPVYLCLVLSFAICALFALKLYYLVYEEALLF
ncbi:hypothetical protein O3Q51_08330 [Cryomorphaceae bacterium 1068]|nr:hypothetical protein [Cryomorphaceae bacterium 1068]